MHRLFVASTGGDETGQRIRETLNVLLESPYFYKTDDERLSINQATLEFEDIMPDLCFTANQSLKGD